MMTKHGKLQNYTFEAAMETVCTTSAPPQAAAQSRSDFTFFPLFFRNHRLSTLPCSTTAWYKRREQQAINELEGRLKLQPENLDTCQPFEWWRGHRAQFPNLLATFCASQVCIFPLTSFNYLLLTVFPRLGGCGGAYFFWWSGHHFTSASKSST